jgi:3-oxoacyl-[acyl-carrier protein] reductase
MDLGLKGRVALVTGASGGIGGAIARTLGCEGARVAVGYHSSPDAAQKTADDIEKVGGEAMTVKLDLNDAAVIAAGIEEVVAKWGGLDVLVTSAWVHPDWPNQQGQYIDPAPVAMWQQQLRINIEGTVSTVLAAIPHMKERGWGRIVLISSGAAEDGSPGREAYAGSKAALQGLSRSLSRGVASAGILTNVVMPGFIPTERNRRFVPPPVLERFAQMTPTGRLATEDDVARMVTFLASEANQSVNGVAVRVSGGLIH